MVTNQLGGDDDEQQMIKQMACLSGLHVRLSLGVRLRGAWFPLATGFLPGHSLLVCAAIAVLRSHPLSVPICHESGPNAWKAAASQAHPEAQQPHPDP